MAAYSAEQGFTKVAAYVIDTGSVIASTEAVGKPAFDAAGVELPRRRRDRSRPG
jgi:branched-chain amino acid transport system substrate-binding protein